MKEKKMTRTHTTKYVTLLSFILALALTAALAACGSDEPSGGTGSVETDREALVAFYNATGGANWHLRGNWLSEEPLGAWHGVYTDMDDGRVIQLWLNNNELSGEIPAELGSLSNLTNLWLGHSGLSGDIPAELSSLSNLIALALSGNELSGEIPAELGSLANLTYLWLYGNNLSGEIPVELGNLAYLETLDLSGNQLSGEIPAELGSLANLTELRLSGNPLSGCVPGSLEDQLTSSDLGDLPFC